MKSVHGVFSGPYFTVFGLNTGKYGPEKTPQGYDKKRKLFRTNSSTHQRKKITVNN